MADTTEIKKVITIDAGDSIQTLSDYKNRIDELKASLEQLDQTSDEYKNTVEEISKLQQQLNNTIDGSSDSIDSLGESYNNLSGKARKFKTGLDDIGDSTDTLNTNISEYSGAFNTAFDKMLDGVQSVDGPLGEVGGTVKNMIPVIRQVNSTAISGLSGIKKAIASTGIGLLVVAVGMLAANWDKVSDAIDNATNKNSIYTKQLNETIARIEEINRKYKEGNQALTDQLKLMASLGATKLEQLKTSKEAAERDKKNFEDEISQNETIIKQLKEKRASIIESNRAASYGATGGGLGADTSAIDKQINALEERNKVLKEGDNDAIEGIDKIDQRIHNLTIDIEAETNTQVRIIENSLKTEEQKLTDNYNTNKALLEEAGKDTTALTERYLKDLASLREKYNNSTTTSQKTELDNGRKAAEELAETVRKNSLTELELRTERYNKDYALLKKYGLDTTELTKQFEKDITEITAKESENRRKELLEEADRRKGWLEQAVQEAEDEASQQKFDLEYSDDYDTMTIQERADAEYEIERGLIEKKIELQQTYLDNFVGTQEEKEVELKKLSDLQRELENADLKHTIETEDRKAAKKKQEQQNLLSSSINLFGALSDLAEEGSEEQKAFSIMQTILNTLQSIMGIWAGYSEMGPFGVAAAAVQTAAVTAMGAATIAKMKSTTKESSSSASVAAPQIPTPSMTSVTPLLDEQSDLNRLETSGVQGESANGTTNMRVYVVDQDIRDANHRAEVVEDNATF